MDSHVQVSCHSGVVLIPIVLGSKIYNHQPSFINDIPICWLLQYQQTAKKITYTIHLYYPHGLMLKKNTIDFSQLFNDYYKKTMGIESE